MANAVFPPIVSKFPFIPFDKVWKSCNSQSIDPSARDISWKISHNILPVQQVLYARNITRILRCHFCASDIETCLHIFYNCSIVEPVIEMLYMWISSMVDKHVDPKSSHIIFNLIESTEMNAKRKDLVLSLLSEYKYAIWMCRNLCKFEKKEITPNFIIMFILNRVKIRVKADLIRMPRYTFMSY